jgi:hypothetical protein
VLLTGRYANSVAALLELVDVTCILVDEQQQAWRPR